MAVQTRNTTNQSTGISGGGGNTNTSSNQSNQSQKGQTFREVDLAQIANLKSSLPEGPTHVLNAANADDAWTMSGPPPAGEYDLKLFPNQNGTGYDYRTPGDESSIFYKAGIECRIVDSAGGEYDNIPIFANVTTKVQRGKDISTMAALLVKMGFPSSINGKEMSPKQVFLLFATALRKEVILRGCGIDWRGSYKDSKGDWHNLCRSMADFPSDPEEPSGHKWQFVHYDRDNQPNEVTAQAQVVKWGSKTRAEGTSTGVGASRQQVATEVMEEPSAPAPAMQPVVAAGKPNGRARVAAPAVAQASPMPVQTSIPEVGDDVLEELLEG